MPGKSGSDNGEEPEGQDSEGPESSQDPDASDADSSAGEGNADDQGTDEFVQPLTPVSPAFDLSSIMPDFSRMMLPLLPNLQDLLPDFTAILPKINIAERLIPAFDLSGLLPKIDYTPLLPKIELLGPAFDFSAILPKVPLPDFAPAFTQLLERLRESLPPNWPDDIDLDRVVAVIQDEGLPLVWVPRAKIVSEMLAAADRAARVEVLLTHVGELLEDCRQVLYDVGHQTLTGQLPLAFRAVDALESGHHEAAQALAVVVTETALARVIGGKYLDIKKQVLFDPELVPYTQLRLRAALAPIGPFYTAWYASSGAPAPEALSRHVTVHQADQSHYTHGNAVVAILLVASVLRALQELQEVAEASDQDGQSA